MLLPENEDFSQMGVKSKDLHFVTAGSKGWTPDSRSLFCEHRSFSAAPPLTQLPSLPPPQAC